MMDLDYEKHIEDLQKENKSLKLQVEFLKQQLEYKTFGKPINEEVNWMSGDAGLDEPIIFYSKKLTESKIVLLSLKGIELNFVEEKKEESNTKWN